MELAIFQGHSEPGNVDHNVSRMKELMVQAKKKGADILVFPELFTTGYMLSNDHMKSLAEHKSGGTFLQLSQQAKTVGIAVLYGYPEAEESDKTQLYYNSVQFIDKEGVSLANYHKIHLWIDEEQYEAVFTPGDSICVFEFCGFKIGLLICFDAEFSEMFRVLALKEAQVILAPTACGEGFNLNPVIDLLLPAHCFSNSVYMAFVNLVDNIFSGCSRVYDNKGQVLVDLKSEEGIFTAVVKKCENTSLHLRHRRPELYASLCEK